MIGHSQSLHQAQTLQQRLSPQQIQYIKLLQLPTLRLEQRIKQEIETNPVLELDDEQVSDDTSEESEATENSDTDTQDTQKDEISSGESEDDPSPVDEHDDIDWDTFFHDDADAYTSSFTKDQEDWRDLPRPYKSSFMEQMEQQVELLQLDERQVKIADQIIGSIDADGYLRRGLDSIIDVVAFHDGMLVTEREAEQVLNQIQRLDPPGIAARNLRECLLIQLEMMDSSQPYRKLAMEIIEKAWPQFEKKHYEKICKKLNITEEQLREANQLIMMLDPKPGESDEYMNPDQFIVPDFEVYFEEPQDASEDEEGEFVIRLLNNKLPNIRISPHYKKMWDAMGNKKVKSSSEKETKQFIREKIESARWFIDSIQQRHNTLMTVMRTITALQEDFFKSGKGLRPMILKDVAERIGMDISTVSRVVNGKFVQTPFGVYELKYFFTEGLDSETGESISNREIKNILQDLVSGEDKSDPLSDQALANALQKKGYPVARRTVSKYREQLNIPVARLRKEFPKNR